MNLINQAIADQSFTLKDKDNGFGSKVVFISPSGTRYGDNDEIIGRANDIGLSIDPDTGTLIVGRSFELDVSRSDILNVIGEIPTENWRCEIEDTVSEKTYFCHPDSGPAEDRTLQMCRYKMKGIKTT